MSKKPNLTQEQLDAMREDYERWNPYAPGAESAEELAARHGVTKSTLYTWRRRGWKLGGADFQGQQGWKSRTDLGATTDSELVPVVKYLTQQLVEARARIDELELLIAQYQDGQD